MNSKFNVHIFAIVRIPAISVVATDPGAAAVKAYNEANLHDCVRVGNAEYAEDIDGFLVDALDDKGDRIGDGIPVDPDGTVEKAPGKNHERKVVAEKKLQFRAEDNTHRTYDVYLRMYDITPGTWPLKGPKPQPDFKWVLEIDETPGRWYITSLLKSRELTKIMSIDHGQGWEVINFDDIITEAMRLL